MHGKKFTIAIALIATMLATTGCSQVADKLDGAEDSSTAPATTSQTMLQTSDWGVVDGLLSVAVTNQSDRILRYGEGVIRGLDADGDVVASSLEQGDAGCCTIVDLAPGDQYGLYVDIGARAERITEVTLSYRNVSWAAAGTPKSLRDVTTTGISLENAPSGAVAVARVTSKVEHAQIGVQAFLYNPDGSLLAVISGRWTCLGAGPRDIRMQLFHPVPAGTAFGKIGIHASESDPTNKAPACDGSGRR